MRTDLLLLLLGIECITSMIICSFYEHNDAADCMRQVAFEKHDCCTHAPVGIVENSEGIYLASETINCTR